MEKKTQSIYMLSRRDPHQNKRHTQDKGKGMEKDIWCKMKKKDFKTKAIVRDKERHYIMTKGMIQQEDITLVNN